MKNFLFALVLCAAPAFASTPSENVDKIDTAREGNLKQLTVKYFQDNLKIACEEGQVAKFDAFKITSESANQEKSPHTPYDYSATYLVVQKCLYGSTYVGAYADTMKSVLVKGSFHSKYNSKNGPAKMEGLAFEYIKDVDVSVPAN
ncbi:MAG: hypothetical protein AB7K68_01855 [Bacteriovoracia bacterium]